MDWSELIAMAGAGEGSWILIWHLKKVILVVFIDIFPNRVSTTGVGEAGEVLLKNSFVIRSSLLPCSL